MKNVLVTGGAGFIGSHLVDYLLTLSGVEVVVCYDATTYAGSRWNVFDAFKDPRFAFIDGNICDRHRFLDALRRFGIDTVFNLAAETHVDRSIAGPSTFVQTNVVGTLAVLESIHVHTSDGRPCRLIHVSTDEVYGTLEVGSFNENSSIQPNSPYAASKAGGDHLVRAYNITYGLDTVTTHCSNNYGPRQFPEKLMPLAISRAVSMLPIPMYGDGRQVRDWIHVSDHCAALVQAALNAPSGSTYNIGGNCELTNKNVLSTICGVLDELRPQSSSYSRLITSVPDRPGHDRRYSVDTSKISSDMNWTPQVKFEDGIASTVLWYLSHPRWLLEVSKDVTAHRGRSIYQ